MDSFFENLNVLPKYGINTRQAVPGQIIKRISKKSKISNDDWQRRQLSFLNSLMQRQQNITDPEKKALFENIVQIYQIHETENYLYVIMEECEQQLYQNISQIDSRIRGNPEKIFEIAQQIIKGYRFLKTTQDNFSLGNIRLDNLLIKTINGRIVIKIAGFEIKKTEEMLISSRFFGQQMYIAPELQKNFNQKPNTQSDIYSIGICLYYMLFGSRNEIHYQDNKLDIQTNTYLTKLIVDMTHLEYNKRISWADLEVRVLYQHPLLYSDSEIFSEDKSEFIQNAQLIMKYYKVLEVNHLQYNDFIRENKSYYKYFKKIECLIAMIELSNCQEIYMLVQLISFISGQDLSIFISEVQQFKYQNLEFIQIKQYFIQISAETSIRLNNQDQIRNIVKSQSSAQRQQQILQNLQKRCEKPKYFQNFIQTYHCDPEDKGCCLIQ